MTDAQVTIQRLVDEIAQLISANCMLRDRDIFECAVARNGEGTYECDINKPCQSCLARRVYEEACREACCNDSDSEYECSRDFCRAVNALRAARK